MRERAGDATKCSSRLLPAQPEGDLAPVQPSVANGFGKGDTLSLCGFELIALSVYLVIGRDYNSTKSETSG